MADAAKDAARILAELPLQPASFLLLYENPKATLAQLFTKIQSTMMLLQESISALESDAEFAVSKSFLVERAEEEADEIKNQLLRSIFSHRSGLEVLTLLQLRDFVLNLDEIADAAEDASDFNIDCSEGRGLDRSLEEFLIDRGRLCGIRNYEPSKVGFTS